MLVHQRLCVARIPPCVAVRQGLRGSLGFPLSGAPLDARRRSLPRGLATARPAVQDGGGPLDLQLLSDLMTKQLDQDPEQKTKLEGIAAALEVPMSAVKSLVYKQRGLANMDPQEVKAKVAKIADILEVSKEDARAMVLIQPGLLFDTDKNAEALRMGLRMIAYELGAPKEEVVELIIKNPSVLHGRVMHLGAADIANLAMLREPRGRVVE